MCRYKTLVWPRSRRSGNSTGTGREGEGGRVGAWRSNDDIGTLMATETKEDFTYRHCAITKADGVRDDECYEWQYEHRNQQPVRFP